MNAAPMARPADTPRGRGPQAAVSFHGKRIGVPSAFGRERQPPPNAAPARAPRRLPAALAMRVGGTGSPRGAMCAGGGRAQPPFSADRVPATTYSPTALPLQYHRRWRTLLPCSEWERVWPLRSGHRDKNDPFKMLEASSVTFRNPECQDALARSSVGESVVPGNGQFPSPGTPDTHDVVKPHGRLVPVS